MDYRTEYRRETLAEESLCASPFQQLRKWLDDAVQSRAKEPTAMCLSTVGESGQPSGRFVLIRQLDEGSVYFFTNYESRKGVELAQHPQASLTAWWPDLERQVRIEGQVERADPKISDQYWSSRPYESRLASAASPQSRPIESRAALSALVHRVEQEHPEEIERPKHWGGMRLIPHRFEFWQGGVARLHDRLVYELHGASWTITRLAP